MSVQPDLRSAESSTALSSMDWLACPDCRGALENGGESLRCSACGTAWPVVNGVPHFVQEFPYWGEVSQEAMLKVNETARTGHWKSALVDSPDESVQKASRMMLNLGRANWHWLTNRPREGRVLDLGAGTGTISHALAQHYREVVAVEPVRERIDFMKQRFTQEGLPVKLLRSSLWKLPFPQSSFDMVAMNGVLEWVPVGRQGDPRQLQQEALRNAWELLKPGGCLYVGIENRTAFGYFVGYPDPHCGLPWVPILPRPLASWYARRKGMDGYRNYLYTSRGYRKLLRNAGFSRTEFYVSLPTYNDPRFLIPLSDRIFRYYSHAFNAAPSGGLRKALRNIAERTGLLKHLEYSFAIIAYK